MKLIIKINKFFSLSCQNKIFFIEAYFYLLTTYFSHILLKKQKIIFSLVDTKNSNKLLDIKQQEIAYSIGKMIQYASSCTLWESTCLLQSLVAKKMLQKRGISGVFYVGVKKENMQIKAHAWTESNAVVITGGRGYEYFTILSACYWNATKKYDNKI